MAEGQGGEKTEKATGHKRNEERKKGNVMQSKDVVTAAFILIVFSTLRFTIKLIYFAVSQSITYWVSICGNGMGDNGQTIDGMQSYAKLTLEIGKTVLIAAGPTLIVGMVVSILASAVQTKFIRSKEQLKFKLSKLNPINGIKKLFSLNSIFELLKSIVKLIVLVVIVYGEIKKRIPDLIRLIDMELIQALTYMCSAIYGIAMKIGMTFVAVAAIDYFFQKYKWEKDMKMTKQEVKEEYKSMEGDPKIKGKRRQIQMQMAMQRMMAAVPEADVIIRNPTHYAVAIKYDAEKNMAPVVVAKGADNLALRIIKIAEENNVTLVENRPLARSLYDAVKLEQEIPPTFYHAVAEVLTFVYELKKRSLY